MRGPLPTTTSCPIGVISDRQANIYHKPSGFPRRQSYATVLPMDETQKCIGESVRALSAAFGDRQEDVAQVLGLSQNVVSKKFRGLVKWSVEDTQAVAKHYGVTVEQVLAGPRAWLGIADQGDGATNRYLGDYHPDALPAMAA